MTDVSVSVPACDPETPDINRLADAWAAMAVEAVLDFDEDYIMRNLALLLRQLSKATPSN